MTSYLNPFTGFTVGVSDTGYTSVTLTSSISLVWSINGATGTIAANIVEVTPTSTGYAIALPAANQVSQGQALIFNNVGANAFTLTDNAGDTLTTINPGAIWFAYLKDNTTVAGIWNVFQYGAAVSQAAAGSLAGNGVVAVGATLNAGYSVNPISANTTLTTPNRAQLVVWNGGSGTITLPSSVTVGNNWFVFIKNNGTGILTITPQGTDAIDNGAASASIQLQLSESLGIVSNGTSGWDTFGYGRSNSFAYTILLVSTTGGTTTLTASQAQNTIQEYTGTLTSNAIIVVPNTVQFYIIYNNTAGAFTFTVKTAAGTGATIAQGQTASLFCDGANVYNAATQQAAATTSVSLVSGSAASPSLSFSSGPNTGLYYIGGTGTTSQMGVAVNGVLLATFAGSAASDPGVNFPGGISGGTF